MRFADNNFALVTNRIYATFLASRKDCVPEGKTRNKFALEWTSTNSGARGLNVCSEPSERECVTGSPQALISEYMITKIVSKVEFSQGGSK